MVRDMTLRDVDTNFLRITEIVSKLRNLGLPGEFTLMPDLSIYYYYYEYYCGDDPSDFFWDEYCWTANLLRTRFPYIEILDSNSDNDSMWFTIRLK